jgi:molybdopterin converting factor subunit 1
VLAIHWKNTTVRRFSDTLSGGPIPGSHILTLVPETAICVKVRLFASYREAAGTAHLEIPLTSGAHVSDLVELLSARLPAVKKAPGMVAVNHTYVGADFTLTDGDEVALIPPVSGGG